MKVDLDKIWRGGEVVMMNSKNTKRNLGQALMKNSIQTEASCYFIEMEQNNYTFMKCREVIRGYESR